MPLSSGCHYLPVSCLPKTPLLRNKNQQQQAPVQQAPVQLWQQSSLSAFTKARKEAQRVTITEADSNPSNSEDDNIQVQSILDTLIQNGRMSWMEKSRASIQHGGDQEPNPLQTKYKHVKSTSTSGDSQTIKSLTTSEKGDNTDKNSDQGMSDDNDSESKYMTTHYSKQLKQKYLNELSRSKEFTDVKEAFGVSLYPPGVSNHFITNYPNTDNPSSTAVSATAIQANSIPQGAQSDTSFKNWMPNHRYLSHISKPKQTERCQSATWGSHHSSIAARINSSKSSKELGNSQKRENHTEPSDSLRKFHLINEKSKENVFSSSHSPRKVCEVIADATSATGTSADHGRKSAPPFCRTESKDVVKINNTAQSANFLKKQQSNVTQLRQQALPLTQQVPSHESASSKIIAAKNIKKKENVDMVESDVFISHDYDSEAEQVVPEQEDSGYEIEGLQVCGKACLMLSQKGSALDNLEIKVAVSSAKERLRLILKDFQSNAHRGHNQVAKSKRKMLPLVNALCNAHLCPNLVQEGEIEVLIIMLKSSNQHFTTLNDYAMLYQSQIGKCPVPRLSDFMKGNIKDSIKSINRVSSMLECMLNSASWKCENIDVNLKSQNWKIDSDHLFKSLYNEARHRKKEHANANCPSAITDDQEKDKKSTQKVSFAESVKNKLPRIFTKLKSPRGTVYREQVTATSTPKCNSASSTPKCDSASSTPKCDSASTTPKQDAGHSGKGLLAEATDDSKRKRSETDSTEKPVNKLRCGEQTPPDEKPKDEYYERHKTISSSKPQEMNSSWYDMFQRTPLTTKTATHQKSSSSSSIKSSLKKKSSYLKQTASAEGAVAANTVTYEGNTAPTGQATLNRHTSYNSKPHHKSNHYKRSQSAKTLSTKDNKDDLAKDIEVKVESSKNNSQLKKHDGAPDKSSQLKKQDGAPDKSSQLKKQDGGPDKRSELKKQDGAPDKSFQLKKQDGSLDKCSHPKKLDGTLDKSSLLKDSDPDKQKTIRQSKDSHRHKHVKSKKKKNKIRDKTLFDVIDVVLDGSEVIGSKHKRGMLERKDCLEMIDFVYNDPRSEPFRQEIRSADIPDYHQIVKYSMCLDQVASKLRRQIYSDLDQFISDVRRVFWNCKLYYKEDTCLERRLCRTVENIFNSQLQIYFPGQDFSHITGCPPHMNTVAQSISASNNSRQNVKIARELRSLLG